MIGKVIHARLTGSTSAATRVYPLILPQAPTLPAVTYQIISTQRLHNFGTDANIQTVRVQVDSWASSYAQARTLADEVFTRLSRVKGIIGPLDVHDIVEDNRTDLYEAGTNIYRVTQDFRLFVSIP
jgi:hypothetical protein